MESKGPTQTESVDALIVGAGLAGLYMLQKLKLQGLTAKIVEAGSGVGGTWFWNRYPGARCDIESLEYSYQFSEELQQEWEWPERYSTQPEILKYANHVADRFELRDDIYFDTRVVANHFNDATQRWDVSTDSEKTFTARFCVMATGCLSSTNTPNFEGLDSFRGPTYHTGQWPHHDIDFSGQRVGIIGTGSSAVQAIPMIAEQAKHLTVFQRTPNFSVPARNEPLDPAVEKSVKADYAGFRELANAAPFAANFVVNEKTALECSQEERNAEYERRWDQGGLGFVAAFSDLIVDKEANDTAADFVRGKIRDVVKDPAVAELLCPKSVVACKRLCADTDYYETYNRENVTLTDVSSDPIDEITPEGLRVGDTPYSFDVLVFATGFDAMTGALTSIDIRGRNGVALKEKWSAGPRTYLGLSTSGFPNLFTISGPGSPSVLTNMLPSIEQHVRWISDCVGHCVENGVATIEASLEAEDDWVEHVNDVAGATLFPTCNSWYLGANVPGKSRVFMPYIGGFPPYVEKCDQVASNDYEGFVQA